MSTKFKNGVWLVLILVGIALKIWLENQPAAAGARTNAPKAEPPVIHETAGKEQRNGFTLLRGARLVDHRDNDGDSFHLLHEGKELELRLYFVDVPEKRLHQYNGDRIRQQGRYFGNLTQEQTIGIGLAAKAFTAKLLQTRPFTVQTRWQKVFDSGRFFAFVFFDEGGGRTEELSEKLVRAGLCRIYTEGANLPDGRRESEFERHLRSLEREAKAKKLGGWQY